MEGSFSLHLKTASGDFRSVFSRSPNVDDLDGYLLVDRHSYYDILVFLASNTLRYDADDMRMTM